jgi:predicted 3-demethylubiquinone-9 3-methyltransferase (glyoxalase superfamily)
MKPRQTITPFLWFDGNAEEAVNFYTSVFKDGRIVSIDRYPDEFEEMRGKVLTAVFELNGQEFMAIDGGPQYKFTEAVSLYVNCESQEEVDAYWNKLAEGGEILMCGWLKDKYGLTWQIIPKALPEMLQDKDRARAKRVMDTMMQMKKIDVAELQKAYDGA